MSDSPSGSADGVWELDGPFGVEKWRQQGDKFTQVTTANATFNLPDDEPDLVELGAQRDTCGHGRFWPSGLKYCTVCGAELQPMQTHHQAAPWSPPFGNDAGLPVVEEDNIDLDGRRTALPMPGKGSFAFMVVGEPARLIAFDMQNGRFSQATRVLPPRDGSDELVAEWSPLGQRRDPASEIPRWSWSAVAHASGAAIPTDGGAVWLARERGRPTHFEAFVAKGQKTQAIGGAAKLHDLALVPMSIQGRLVVAAWRFGGEAWHIVEPSGDRSALPKGFLAAPVSNGDEVYWIGARVLLRAYWSDGSAAIEVIPWRSGFVPELGLRPVSLRNGSFLALGRIGDQLEYQELRPADATPTRREARGYAVSYGEGVFREGRRYLDPSERTSVGRYQLSDGEFLSPVLAFARLAFLVAICSGRTSLLNFFDVNAPSEQRTGRLAVCGSRNTVNELGRTVHLAKAWDVVPFIFAGRLYLYESCDNLCWSWPLVSPLDTRSTP